MSEHTCDGRGFVDCRELVTESDGRCVFHSEMPDKPLDKMQDVLMKMQDARSFDCRGWVIPISFGFNGLAIDNASFNGTIFEVEAFFENTTFKHYAGFHDAVFKRAARFQGATFKESAFFPRAHFHEEAQFPRTTFEGDAWFRLAVFEGQAAFHEKTIFKKKSGFDDAVFKKYSWFEGADFGAEAGFRGATFQRHVWFRRATFHQDAMFLGSNFKESPSFVGTQFLGRANFEESTFAAQSTLDQTHFSVPTSFSFTDLSLVTFRRCVMQGVSLTEAYGVAQAEYDACIWGDTCLIPEEKNALETKEKSGFFQAERVLREIRRSLEDRKHFQEANRFAYRELEMRRLGYLAERRPGLDWLRGQIRANIFSYAALYHQLGSYGDSVTKPLAWLLLSVFALFPALYVLAGITIGGFPYHLGGPWNPGPLWDFSLRTAALLPTDGGDKVMGAALLLQVIERVWSPFLALLFTLAVRRRFRR